MDRGALPAGTRIDLGGDLGESISQSDPQVQMQPAQQPVQGSAAPGRLAEFRQRYPQYDDMPDDELAQSLHAKYYSDIPYNEFATKIGVQAQSPEVTPLDRVNAGASGFNAGVAGLLGLPVDTAANVLDLVRAAAGTAYMEATGKPVPRALEVDTDRRSVIGSGDWIRERMGSAAELPRPDDPASRYLHAAGMGATAAVAPGRGPQVAPGLVRALGPSAVAGVAGAEAGQLAAEKRASPEMQLLAQTAGSVIPGVAGAVSSAAVRGAVRGGETGRARMAENIQTFENAGTRPSVGQATQNRRTQATESLLARTPGGAGVMARRGEAQAGEIGSNIERLASELAPRSSAEQAGRAIQRGVSGEGGFIEQFKAQSTANYDVLDRFVPKGSKFGLPETTKALDQLTKPVAGATRTSGFFVNPKVQAIKEALGEDLSEGGDALPYDAVKRLRSIVGEQLADAPFNGDVPRSQWKKLYAAMSADIEANAKATDAANGNANAQQALARANRYHAAGMRRLDYIGNVIDRNGGPEAIYRAAISGNKEGATTLRAVMQSLPADAQRTLSAATLRRLGRAKSGAQDDLGERFSTETFLSNWTAMSPQAKAALFDRYGDGFRQDLDQVARVASNLRQGSQVFRNPSGTGQAVAQSTTAATFVVSVLSGHLGTAGAIAGGVATANIAARALTNPTAVKWLARATKAPETALPALIAQAARSNDADLRELGELLATEQQ